MPNEIYGTVKEWLEYAHRDLSSAKYLCSMLPKPLEIICYHCQQCAEKALKSFLIENNREIIRTHDLMLLQSDCKKTSNVFDTISLECAVLKNFSVTSRYPYPLEITEDDTEKALNYAETVLKFVESQLHK